MIYTVTLNPSIDYIVRLDKVEIGSVNRMDSDDKFAGGKGINVSRVLKRLGIPNTATGSEDTVIIPVVKRSHEQAFLVLDRKQTVLCVVDVV